MLDCWLNGWKQQTRMDCDGLCRISGRKKRINISITSSTATGGGGNIRILMLHGVCIDEDFKAYVCFDSASNSIKYGTHSDVVKTN